jgi:hypothetical protein
MLTFLQTPVVLMDLFHSMALYSQILAKPGMEKLPEPAFVPHERFYLCSDAPIVQDTTGTNAIKMQLVSLQCMIG